MHQRLDSLRAGCGHGPLLMVAGQLKSLCVCCHDQVHHVLRLLSASKSCDVEAYMFFAGMQCSYVMPYCVRTRYACHALPCPAPPRPALPCPALPCPALPCPALPCPALPCRALPQYSRTAYQLQFSVVSSTRFALLLFHYSLCLCCWCRLCRCRAGCWIG